MNLSVSGVVEREGRKYGLRIESATSHAPERSASEPAGHVLAIDQGAGTYRLLDNRGAVSKVVPRA